MKKFGRLGNWWKVLKEPDEQMVSQVMLSDALWFVLVATMRETDLRYRHLGTIRNDAKRAAMELRLYCKAVLIHDLAERLKLEGITKKNEQSEASIQQVLDNIEKIREERAW